jgi:hypothetical protein
MPMAHEESALSDYVVSAEAVCGPTTAAAVSAAVARVRPAARRKAVGADKVVFLHASRLLFPGLGRPIEPWVSAS